MNGIFPADLAVYLLLLPIANYVFWTHRWTGALPWYYVNIFCCARIIGGGLGVKDSASLSANIIQSVAITPLLLGVDGLIHEVRMYRYPGQSSLLSWGVVAANTSTMAASISLSIVGALAVYKGTATSTDYTLWKVGATLTCVVWAFLIVWAVVSSLPSRWKTEGPAHNQTTALLRGAYVALLFAGIRIIYTAVAVFTQDRKLSPVYGSTAVRVVLMFLPEVLAVLAMLAAGVQTRHLREMKGKA